jgi:hypothetical protein
MPNTQNPAHQPIFKMNSGQNNQFLIILSILHQKRAYFLPILPYFLINN